jgi:ElaA protein
VNSTIIWQLVDLAELPTRALYAVLAAREAVFVVEQACAYQELDGLDFEARHLIAWSQNAVAAYARLLPPGKRFAEASFGRVLTTAPFRGLGLGRATVSYSLRELHDRYAGSPVRISAQAHLSKFYGSFGFQPASAVYVEDGIEHIEMLERRAVVGRCPGVT